MVLFSSVETFRPGVRAPGRNDSLFKHSEPLTLHHKTRGYAEVELAMLQRTKVGRVRSTGHDISVLVDGHLTVLLPQSGMLISEIHDKSFRAGVNEALILSPNPRQTRVEVPQGGLFEAIPLLFAIEDVRQVARELGTTVLKSKRLGDFGLKLSAEKSPLVTQFIQLSQMLVQDIDSSISTISSSGAHSWSRLLLEKLVVLLDQNDVIELPGDNRDTASYRHVFRAEEYMHEHFAEISTVADIAGVCGISVRSLEMAFRTVRSQSPMALLGDIRLDRAHRMLGKQNGLQSVTNIALGCGFMHLGRFSGAYRRRYGETPSEAMRKK